MIAFVRLSPAFRFRAPDFPCQPGTTPRFNCYECSGTEQLQNSEVSLDQYVYIITSLRLLQRAKVHNRATREKPSEKTVSNTTTRTAAGHCRTYLAYFAVGIAPKTDTILEIDIFS